MRQLRQQHTTQQTMQIFGCSEHLHFISGIFGMPWFGSQAEMWCLGQYLDLQRSVLNFNKTGRAGDLWTVSFMTFLSLLQAITWQWWFPPDHVLQTTGWPGEMAQWHTGNSGSFNQETDISRHDVNHSKNVGRFHTNGLNNYQICNKHYN